MVLRIWNSTDTTDLRSLRTKIVRDEEVERRLTYPFAVVSLHYHAIIAHTFLPMSFIIVPTTHSTASKSKSIRAPPNKRAVHKSKQIPLLTAIATTTDDNKSKRNRGDASQGKSNSDTKVSGRQSQQSRYMTADDARFLMNTRGSGDRSVVEAIVEMIQRQIRFTASKTDRGIDLLFRIPDVIPDQPLFDRSHIGACVVKHMTNQGFYAQLLRNGVVYINWDSSAQQPNTTAAIAQTRQPSSTTTTTVTADRPIVSRGSTRRFAPSNSYSFGIAKPWR